MTLYAQTNIRHGNEDGTVTEIAEGDEVTGLPDDVMEQLEESGAVKDTPPRYDEVSTDAELRARDDRIAELEAALAEAKGEKPAETAEAKQAVPPTKK